MKYKEGQIVHVRLAGLIVAGIIKSIDKSGDYVIQFEGGSEKSISERFIKLVEDQTLKFDIEPPKTEMRSPSRRSPSRRSPGRIRSKASPSPGRRSPGRRAKASPSPSRARNVSRSDTPRILKVSLENIDVSGDYLIPTLRKKKPSEYVPDSTVEPNILTSDKLIENDYLKNSGRNSENIVHLKQNKNILNDLDKLSDDEEIVTEVTFPSKERKIGNKLIRSPKEFGGLLGTFILTFFIPGMVLSLHVICGKSVCRFTELPDLTEYKFLSTYFDTSVIFSYLSYVTLIVLLSKVPYVGKSISSQPSKEKVYIYRMNGLFTAFFILGIIALCEIENIPIIDFLYYKYFQFLVCALVFGFITSILLFVKSRYAPVSLLNPYASTYNSFYDFFMGRQVNPRILGIDLKIILLRASYITVLIFNSVYLYKSLDVLLLQDIIVSLDTSLFVCAILQIFYVLDFLLFEKNLTTTFELQYEGLGYMKTMLYASYPFYVTSITKYLYEHEPYNENNNWLLGVVCLAYLIGYVMYRGSNSQKNAFRINPHDAALSSLKSLPTGHGKKLLISGWWSLLRHPNYCGDIIMHLAMGALGAGGPAALGPLPPALLLVVRAVRDSHRCHRRYGDAWDQYKLKIRYNIFPFVY